MVWTSAKKYFNCFKLFYYILPYLIFHLHCHLVLRISGNTIIGNIKTRQSTKFSLAGLASRNIVHLQKIILRCCGFCLYISTGCLSCKGNEMISTASCSLLCVDNFVFNSEEYGITYYKRLPGPVTEWESQRPPSMAMKITTTKKSAILVLPQTFRGRKMFGFKRKSFTRQNSPNSKVFGFNIPTLNSGFKISGDMTKTKFTL